MILTACYIAAFLAPGIGFCSLNTNFFTSAQIIASLLILLLMGILAAAGAHWALAIWPDHAPVLYFTAAFCFVLLNERFFTETFGSLKKGIAIATAFLAVCWAAAATGWHGAILALLLIYAAFSAWDLAKNWKRPKTPLFDKPPCPDDAQAAGFSPVKFVSRPNVYLLLLESMHSSEALRKVYNLPNRDAEALMEEHGLTIYPHTFSNKHSTPLSLQTLLSMSLDQHAPAETLRIFKKNGYACFFFDTMYYLAQPYLPYIDNGNTGMGKWALWLYSFAGPLFAQSVFTRMFAGNVDPFETKAEIASHNRAFENMLDDFRQCLAARDPGRPAFHVLHFGAQHFGDLWFRINAPEETYLQWYKQGVAELKNVLEAISSNDPDAVIVAVGDHGAYHWTGVTAGPAQPEKNAAANGVSADRLANDFFGVILGIKWGRLVIPHVDVLSHVNIFRWLVAALSGKKRPEMEMENISILDGKHVVARDGRALANFEMVKDPAMRDYYPETVIRPELLEGLFELESALKSGSLEYINDRADELYTLAEKSGRYSLQHFQAAQALVRAGRIRQGFEILDAAWERAYKDTRQGELDDIYMYYEPYIYLVRVCMAVRNFGRALEIIDYALKNKPAWPTRQTLRLKMHILNINNKFTESSSLIPQVLKTRRSMICEPIDQFPLELYLCVTAIENSMGWKKAFEWLDSQMPSSGTVNTRYYVLVLHKILLLLQYGENAGAMNELEGLFLEKNVPAGFILLYMRLCVLSENLEKAREFHDRLDCLARLRENPLSYVLREDIFKKGSREKLMALTLDQKMSEIISSSPYFDAEWYNRQYRPGLPAARDFLKNGMALLRNPSRDFDLRFFLCAHPEVFFPGIEPLVYHADTHYLLSISPLDDNFIRTQVSPKIPRLPQEAS